jgi:hypothetical protein
LKKLDTVILLGVMSELRKPGGHHVHKSVVSRIRDSGLRRLGYPVRQWPSDLHRYAKLKRLRYIAIDEIAVAKGHRYLTVVMDLVSGAIVLVGDGKGADALKPFWKRLRPSKVRIEAVAVDMPAA